MEDQEPMEHVPVVLTTDGKFVLADYMYSYGAGGADFWLVKTALGTPPLPSRDFSIMGDSNIVDHSARQLEYFGN